MLHELDHSNLIKLHKVMKAKNKKDLYLVFDFMEADLQSLIGFVLSNSGKMFSKMCMSDSSSIKF